MSVTATGFDGTIDYVQWAIDMPQLAGIDYCCTSGWMTSAVAGANQTVKVSSGSGVGWGVTLTTPDASIALPTVSKATWFLVGWRITWTPQGGSVKLDYDKVDISATPTAPDPGKTALLPIAHVQITPGQQLPTSIIDRRKYASQLMTASSTSGLYWASEGDMAMVGGVTYRYTGNQWTSLRQAITTWDAAQANSASLTSGTSVPAGNWVFCSWVSAANSTLAMTTDATGSGTSGLLWRFPSAGIYSIGWNFQTTPGGSGSMGVFTNPSIPHIITDSPTGLYRSYTGGQSGTAVLAVSDPSKNYAFAYHNDSTAAQKWWVGGVWLSIIRLGDLA